jgi:phosphate starvation-inducible protein PhoH and related proteins
MANKKIVETEKNTKPRESIKSYVNKMKKYTLTAKQRKLLQLIDENKIIIIRGPAGTGKTFMTSYYITDKIAKHDDRFENFILTKPVEEAGEKLGLLPGDVKDKIGPHYESYMTNLKRMIPEKDLTKYFEKEKIAFKPLAYCRGADWTDACAILDEAQNADIRQLIMFITRMGRNSKIILTGDTKQYDIGKKSVSLDYLAELIGDVNDVAVFDFTEEDIMRDPILIEITKRYELAKSRGDVPINKR